MYLVVNQEEVSKLDYLSNNYSLVYQNIFDALVDCLRCDFSKCKKHYIFLVQSEVPKLIFEK